MKEKQFYEIALNAIAIFIALENVNDSNDYRQILDLINKHNTSYTQLNYDSAEERAYTNKELEQAFEIAFERELQL